MLHPYIGQNLRYHGDAYLNGLTGYVIKIEHVDTVSIPSYNRITVACNPGTRNLAGEVISQIDAPARFFAPVGTFRT